VKIFEMLNDALRPIAIEQTQGDMEY
jgi:hypothetical protein